MKYPELYRERFDIRELHRYEDFEKIVSGSRRVWVLSSALCDISGDAEEWLRTNNAVVADNYQLEEHTIEGLKESWATPHRYSSYLYRLYLYENR